MTKERYKQILEGDLKFLNKLQVEGEIHLSTPFGGNLLKLMELKLKIADRLCKLEENENS